MAGRYSGEVRARQRAELIEDCSAPGQDRRQRRAALPPARSAATQRPVVAPLRLLPRRDALCRRSALRARSLPALACRRRVRTEHFRTEDCYQD
jgi:hypothetical protein